MNTHIKIILFSLISLLVINGCSLSPMKAHNISYYQLNTSDTPLPKAQRQSRTTRYTLFVSKPVANAGYDTNAMIYIVRPYQLRSYAYNQWVDSPANMLMDVLTDNLQRSNYFHAVTFPPSLTHTDFRLNTQVIMFQQEFLQPESQFHLVLQATLINNRTQRVIATRRFESIVAAPGNDPYSGVNAANVAANEVALKLTQFCTRAIR
jgi:cholesterol transport system auxiliary component